MNDAKYVFFDCDHTIFEWTVDWGEAFVQAAVEAGVIVPKQSAWEAIEQTFAADYEQCLLHHAARRDPFAFWMDFDGRIFAHLGVTDNRDSATRRVIELMTRPGAIKLYDEVPEVLAEFARYGVHMGIVTSRPAAGPDLEALGIAHYFSPVLDALALGCTKTEGTMFRLAAEAAQEKGATAWHVGDSYEDDVLGARAAGLQPVLLDREQQRPEADCDRATDLRELLPLVLNGHILR